MVTAESDFSPERNIACIAPNVPSGNGMSEMPLRKTVSPCGAGRIHRVKRLTRELAVRISI
jgi:hypothetical protein